MAHATVPSAALYAGTPLQNGTGDKRDQHKHNPDDTTVSMDPQSTTEADPAHSQEQSLDRSPPSLPPTTLPENLRNVYTLTPPPVRPLNIQNRSPLCKYWDYYAPVGWPVQHCAPAAQIHKPRQHRFSESYLTSKTGPARGPEVVLPVIPTRRKEDLCIDLVFNELVRKYGSNRTVKWYVDKLQELFPDSGSQDERVSKNLTIGEQQRKRGAREWESTEQKEKRAMKLERLKDRQYVRARTGVARMHLLLMEHRKQEDLTCGDDSLHHRFIGAAWYKKIEAEKDAALHS